MLQRTLLLAALVGTACCLGTRATAADEDKSGLSPEQFVMKASADGLGEVNLALLALQNSTNPDVRQFAQRMLDDHTKANRQLNAIADRERIRPAAQMDEQCQKLYDRVSRLRGAEFDREYVRAMVKDHDRAVDLFEKEKDLKDKDLRDFAAKTVDTLKDHKEMAHKLADKLGVKDEGNKEDNKERRSDKDNKDKTSKDNNKDKKDDKDR
jgi:putative membrane protein